MGAIDDKIYEAVKQLHNQGYSITEIAKKLKINSSTVKKNVMKFFRTNKY